MHPGQKRFVWYDFEFLSSHLAIRPWLTSFVDGLKHWGNLFLDCSFNKCLSFAIITCCWWDIFLPIIDNWPIFSMLRELFVIRQEVNADNFLDQLCEIWTLRVRWMILRHYGQFKVSMTTCSMINGCSSYCDICFLLKCFISFQQSCRRCNLSKGQRNSRWNSKLYSVCINFEMVDHGES